MIEPEDWHSVRTFLADKNKILVTTHFNPDGDAIGSEVAIALYLEQLGKQAYLINCDKTPKFLHFLDPENKIQQYNEEQHDALFRTLDAAIIVDISDWKRLREVGQAIRKHSLPVACIDHHIPTDNMGEVQISDQNASSTGELLYEFLVDSKAEMTQPIVDALYTCILTDTGSFRFSNTTPKTHRITADLLQQGAHFREIYSNVYENYSKNRMKLKGMLLANMNFECSDKLAWFVLSQELLQQSGAEMWETDGFSELPRSIEGVEISVMFMETPEGTTKLSFRSKGHVAINGLANKFDGGGHKFASGAIIAKPLAEAIPIVVEEAKTLLKSNNMC